MPELHKYVCMYVEDHFGHERGFLNNAMATVYETGKNQYIPLHADKAHSFEATGKIENKAPIYNCVDTGLCNSLTSSKLHRHWRSIKSPGGSSLRCHEGNERLVSFLLLVFAPLAGQPLDNPRLPWAAHHQCVYCLAHILQNAIDDQAQDELGLQSPFPDHQRVWVHPPGTSAGLKQNFGSTSPPAALAVP